MIFILEWDSSWGRRSTYYKNFSAPLRLACPRQRV